MKLLNIFKKEEKETIERKMGRGNKSNLFTSTVLTAAVIVAVGFAIKPDSTYNDSAIMLAKMEESIKQKEAEEQAIKQKEKDNAARRDYYIQTLKNKGLNREQIRLHIMQLSDEQKRNKGFPVKTIKENYEDKIIKLKERQQRDKEVINNLNVSVNKKTKRRSPNFS